MQSQSANHRVPIRSFSHWHYELKRIDLKYSVTNPGKGERRTQRNAGQCGITLGPDKKFAKHFDQVETVCLEIYPFTGTAY